MNSTQYKNDWKDILGRLRTQYGETAYRNGLCKIALQNFDGTALTLVVATPTLQHYIEKNYRDYIQDEWHKKYPDTHTIHITASPLHASNDEMDTAIGNIGYTGIPSTVPPLFSFTPNPQCTFDTYMVNERNTFAYEMARSVASNATTSPNPLYICGGVGLGKTHLLHAIAQDARTRFTDKVITYLTAESFTNAFTKALRDKTINTFKETLRTSDILLVDDIHFIANKHGTQEEFFHTFNALIDKHCKIVLSGNLAPAFLQDIDKKLISRMNGGMVAQIERPNYDLRYRILQKKSAQMSHLLDTDAIDFLANNITHSDIRELEGALNRVISYAKITDTSITPAFMKHVLHDILTTNTKIIKIDDIQKAVANHYNISLKDLLSKSRKQNIARPRQLAMYIAKALTRESLPAIARKFGRDHTTIIHAIQRIEDLLESEPTLEQDLDTIRHTIKQ